jgi:hypothetical protein
LPFLPTSRSLVFHVSLPLSIAAAVGIDLLCKLCIYWLV